MADVVMMLIRYRALMICGGLILLVCPASIIAQPTDINMTGEAPQLLTTSQLMAEKNYQMAISHLRKGHIVDALAMLRQTLSRNPNHIPAARLVAAIITEVRDSSATRQAMGGKIKDSDEFTLDRVRLEKILVNTGIDSAHGNIATQQQDAIPSEEHKKAVEFLNQMLARNPSHQAASSLLGELTAAENAMQTPGATEAADPYRTLPEGQMQRVPRPFSPQENAENNFRRAVIALKNGDQPLARELLQQALSYNHLHQPAGELLASLLMQAGQWDEARPVLEEGLKSTPVNQSFSYGLIRVYIEQGKYDQALDVIDKLVPGDHVRHLHIGMRASILQRLGQHKESREEYTRAISLSPEEGRWWVGLGISAEALQDWQAAHDAYLKVQTNTRISENLQKFVKQRLLVVEQFL